MFIKLENVIRVFSTDHFFLTANFVMKVEVWRGKDVAAVAKELTVLAENNDLHGYGLIWIDRTPHEDGIKVSIFLHTQICF